MALEIEGTVLFAVWITVVALELLAKDVAAVEALVTKVIAVHIVGGRNDGTLPRKVIFTDLSEDKIMRFWIGKEVGGVVILFFVAFAATHHLQ